MKKILIITLVVFFGCSKLPWKKDAPGLESVEQEEMAQEEVQVEQLYGLHSMQGAEIKSQKNNIEYLEIKIDSIDGKQVTGGFSLSIGNPHVIFFVEDFSKFNLREIGPKVENHSYFPEKCNVTLANIKNKKHVKVKVWERGAGLTKACGTAACATAVSGAVLELNERCVDIEFSEGILNIDWKKDNNIYMTGKISEVKQITVSI